MEWIEDELPIATISRLLGDGYEIEVDSPDGFVPVSFFVDKGSWDEYILTTTGGKVVRCNENHLFETTDGWRFAKDLVGGSTTILTESGPEVGAVVVTGAQIPIVDIQVDHPNHRYYTNGVSSHNTGLGKTIFMCHNAASFMASGYNVLYITLEMAQERIAERIDANLMGVNIDDIASLTPESFKKRIEFIREKTPGRLIIKEYPTSSANANNFRALLKELSIKKRFKPDVIFIDYLNLCQSVRYPKSDSSFQVVKAVAEEIRGLGMEYDASVWSATQLNREGFGSSDADLTHVAESFGVPQTADLFLLLMVDEHLDAAGQVLFKQLKNRYRDLNKDRRFLVGLNKDRMTFYNLDLEEQVKVAGIAKRTDPDPATTTTKAFFTKDTKFKKKELFDTDEDL